MSLPSHQSYHATRVKWLGKMPSHWTIKRFKLVFRERNERSESGNEELLSVSAFTGVNPRRDGMSDGDHISRADSLEGYKRCYPDDLVMNIMLAWNRGLGFSRYDGIVSPAYCVFHVIDKSSPRFLDYLVRSDDYISYFKCFSAGVIDSRLRMYPDAFLSLSVALPPLPEQIAIAAFLDRETAKIDALVEQQLRLIELLKEKHQAVISHAVTKGLDQTVPMKESGAEWLGEVPAQWEVIPLKRRVSILPGYAFPSGGFSANPAGTPLLRGLNVAVGRIRWDNVVYWSRKESDGLDAFELRAGDVVLGMDRPWIGDGLRVAQVSETDLPCLLLQRVAALRPSQDLMPDYLPHLLSGEAFHHHCVPDMTGVSVPHISPTQIGNFVVALPPLEEQHTILKKLTQAAVALEPLVLAAEESVGLLQERRAALISAAVTGKIDVRGTASLQAEAA